MNPIDSDPNQGECLFPRAFTQPVKPLQWAILELMGHQRLAGAVSDQTVGGATLLRVDVPEVIVNRETFRNGDRATDRVVIPAHTCSVGPSSIFRISWVDEAAAVIAAHSIRHQPVQPYSLREALEAMPDDQRVRMLALTAGTTVAGGGDD